MVQNKKEKFTHTNQVAERNVGRVAHAHHDAGCDLTQLIEARTLGDTLKLDPDDSGQLLNRVRGVVGPYSDAALSTTPGHKRDATVVSRIVHAARQLPEWAVNRHVKK